MEAFFVFAMAAVLAGVGVLAILATRRKARLSPDDQQENK